MNSLNDYLNLWFSRLTSFGIEGTLNSAIFSTITDNLNHQYLIKLNKDLSRSSYESIPEILLLQNNSEIQASEDDYKNDPRVIKSPMVGTVYLQPEPGANKFVNIGDSVKSGQTILIVEAMKTMNPIESSLQGKVIKILVENEQAVEFGQPLMLIG